MVMSEQLAIVAEHPSAAYLDVATATANLNALKMRHNLLLGAMKDVLHENIDYGKIPGTSDKPTLLKAGAENLSFLFGLRPTFEVVDRIEDWDGGLFYYRYRCTLSDGSGRVVANSEGSCNSRETKYRYRNSTRRCPKCGKETIIKGKSEYGGGWLCFAKKGGCGAKFSDGDATIESQEVGKVENPEPYELVNTLQKMAQKRALVAAVLIGTGASQFFTQDIEDMGMIAIDAPAVREITPESTTVKAEPQAERQAKAAEVKEAVQNEAAEAMYPEAMEPAPHWIDDPETRGKFWGWTRNQGLSQGDVYTALEVVSVHDYPGSKAEAMSAIKAYVKANTQPEPEREADGPGRLFTD